MRNQLTVELDPDRLAVVRELRVRDVRHLLTQLQGTDWQQADLLALARDRLPELLTLAGDSLTLPEGTALDDLTLSECEAIGRAWWELHRGFFAPLAALGQAHAARATATPARSTAPA